MPHSVESTIEVRQGPFEGGLLGAVVAVPFTATNVFRNQDFSQPPALVTGYGNAPEPLPEGMLVYDPQNIYRPGADFDEPPIGREYVITGYVTADQRLSSFGDKLDGPDKLPEVVRDRLGAIFARRQAEQKQPADSTSGSIISEGSLPEAEADHFQEEWERYLSYLEQVAREGADFAVADIERAVREIGYRRRDESQRRFRDDQHAGLQRLIDIAEVQYAGSNTGTYDHLQAHHTKPRGGRHAR